MYAYCDVVTMTIYLLMNIYTETLSYERTSGPCRYRLAKDYLIKSKGTKRIPLMRGGREKKLTLVLRDETSLT
jgi:hypothetical protein